MAEFYSATVRLFDRFCGPVLLRDSHSQFRVVGHDLGGTTHRTCPLSDFEPRSTWLKGATWEIPGQLTGRDGRARSQFEQSPGIA